MTKIYCPNHDAVSALLMTLHLAALEAARSSMIADDEHTSRTTKICSSVVINQSYIRNKLLVLRTSHCREKSSRLIQIRVWVVMAVFFLNEFTRFIL